MAPHRIKIKRVDGISHAALELHLFFKPESLSETQAAGKPAEPRNDKQQYCQQQPTWERARGNDRWGFFSILNTTESSTN